MSHLDNLLCRLLADERECVVMAEAALLSGNSDDCHHYLGRMEGVRLAISMIQQLQAPPDAETQKLIARMDRLVVW